MGRAICLESRSQLTIASALYWIYKHTSNKQQSFHVAICFILYSKKTFWETTTYITNITLHLFDLCYVERLFDTISKPYEQFSLMTRHHYMEYSYRVSPKTPRIIEIRHCLNGLALSTRPRCVKFRQTN
jgi:hypothetical protein